MKKKLALLLSASLILALTACSSTDSSTDDNVASTEASASSGKEDTSSTAESASSSTDDSFVQIKKLTRGTIDGNVYTNEYLDFSINKPDNWVFYSDEEIATLLSFSLDVFTTGDFEKTLDENMLLYDMMVYDPVTLSNLSVAYENLAKTVGFIITEEQYIEALKTQMATHTIMDVTFSDEIETVKLGNQEYKRVLCTTVAEGVTMTQAYYLAVVDKYMSLVTITLANGCELADVEAMFQ